MGILDPPVCVYIRAADYSAGEAGEDTGGRSGGIRFEGHAPLWKVRD